MNEGATIRVFRYVDELDAFLVTDEFIRIADYLGLTEWHSVVWVGRLFRMDNDVGEHWFDNWDERDALEAKAEALGIRTFDLMIVRPEGFADGQDGPCHSPEMRKRFWTDVLKSLELSYELLFEEARSFNAQAKVQREQGSAYDDYLPDLEERLAQVEAGFLPPPVEEATSV